MLVTVKEGSLLQGVDGLPQGIHMLLLRGPACAEAHAGMVGVHPLPVLIAEALADLSQLRVGHDGVLLVGGGVEQQGIARRHEDVPDLMRHVDGVAGDLEVQIVGEQGVELHAQQDPATDEPFATYTEQATLTVPQGAALSVKTT